MAYTPRQNLLIRAYLFTVSKVGQWVKGHGPDGAGYVSARENVEADAGLRCENCAFWRAPQGCSLVRGQIEPRGYCHLIIVDPSRMSMRGKVMGVESLPSSRKR
jgi:hypothetical protein